MHSFDNPAKTRIGQPGGAIASRPLPFIFICDVSGSMAGEKIQSLNYAICEALPHMQREAASFPMSRVMMQVVTFAANVTWTVAEPTPVADLRWTDLAVPPKPRCLGTAAGAALEAVALALPQPPATFRQPVLVLVTDGAPTDDFDAGLERLLETPAGEKANRIAIAIGQDASCDLLARFNSDPLMPPLRAHNAQDLVRTVQWASSVPIRASSIPRRSAVESPPNAASIPRSVYFDHDTPPGTSGTAVW
jgi:uncharacterized protein YegL